MGRVQAAVSEQLPQEKERRQQRLQALQRALESPVTAEVCMVTCERVPTQAKGPHASLCNCVAVSTSLGLRISFRSAKTTETRQEGKGRGRDRKRCQAWHGIACIGPTQLEHGKKISNCAHCRRRHIPSLCRFLLSAKHGLDSLMVSELQSCLVLELTAFHSCVLRRQGVQTAWAAAG